MMSLYRNKVIVLFCLIVVALVAWFCALPTLLTVTGYGQALAHATRAWPSVIFLGEQKFLCFLASGCLLLLADSLMRPRATPAQATTALEHNLFWAAIGIWALGVYVSYLALPLAILLRG